MVQRYERMRHISTGRFGQTMLVKGGGRLFVMKTIDVGRLGPKQREELLREVSEMALLRHPHLEIMRESFVEGGSLCIMTEYVEGGNLAETIEKARGTGDTLPASRVLQWFSQAALALKHMHDLGALHRDVRSKRLLLTPQWHLVLSGCATSALLANSLAPGRPELEAVRYLAPELLSGRCEHSCASDMWALGVVLFELLALRPPFEHSHPWLLAEQIRQRQVPPVPGPPELQQICATLLQREPTKRPSAGEALQEPAVQRRLLALLAEDAVPLPELRPAGGGPAAGGARPAPGTPAKRWPQAPRATPISGPVVLSALSTPRGLVKVGERCLQKGAMEMRAPPAVWKRGGKPPPSAPTVGLLGLTAERPFASSGPMPTTPNLAASEVASGLVTEIFEDVSLATVSLLEGGGSLGTTGLLSGGGLRAAEQGAE